MPKLEEILLNATQAYQRLLNIEYIVTVGKNKELKTYKLQFTTDEYKHLFGLHKLDDRLDIKRSPSNAVFESIINGKINCSYVVSSKNYARIRKRVENIADLEEYIDQFNQIYDWNMVKARSDIHGDRMVPSISIKDAKNNIYIFFNDGGIESTELRIGDIVIGEFNIEIPISFIVEPHKDYTANLVRPATVLYKEKSDKSTQTKVTLLDKLSK